MKGKLIKCNHFYTLQIESDIIAVSLDKESESHTVNYEHSISLKNCQAIENGYDLDELSKKETRKFLGHDVPENIMLFIAHSKMFQKGFQKALEILGDKKFSEEDMEGCWYSAHQAGRFEGKGIAEKDWQTFDTYIKESLQQTEWEVEVVYHRACNADNFNCGNEDKCQICTKVCPKLDADGCLILKKIE